MKPRGQVIPRGNRHGARVYLPGKGRQWLGTFATEKEARAEIDLALDQGRAPSAETVGEFAARWTKDYPRSRVSTNKTNSGRAGRVVAERHPITAAGQTVVLPDLPMRRVSRPVARAYAIRHPQLHPALRAMFNNARDDGLVERNPFEKLGLPQSKGRRDIVALTEVEIAMLGDAALIELGTYGPSFRALLYFAGYVGIRQGELFALEHSDIDLAKLEVHVRRRAWGNQSDRDIDLPKSGRTRTVILPPPARDALLEAPRRADTQLVFTNTTGKPLTKTSFAWYWHKTRAAFEAQLAPTRLSELLEGRGGKKLAAHELRHAAATILLERGVSASDVAEQLGHVDGGILVSRLYGHPSKVAARERIRRAFSEPVPLRAVDSEAVEGGR